MEMENELRGYYSELANGINEMIPVEWKEVYFLGEVGRGRTSWGCIFYFKEEGSDVWTRSDRAITIYGVPQKIYMEEADKLMNLVIKTYDCFIANDQQGWEEMTLYLTSTGKFDIRFAYDLDDYFYADAGPIAREAIWAYETFGKIPGNDTTAKKYLNTYLERKEQRENEKDGEGSTETPWDLHSSEE